MRRNQRNMIFQRELGSVLALDFSNEDVEGFRDTGRLSVIDALPHVIFLLIDGACRRLTSRPLPRTRKIRPDQGRNLRQTT